MLKCAETAPKPLLAHATSGAEIGVKMFYAVGMREVLEYVLTVGLREVLERSNTWQRVVLEHSVLTPF